ncbi:hypothetical protein TPHA_0D03900 [Tetrapisispora phaffii CBS 4417]|uniref:Fork-head domain-containing protein n=1 Tax=Tetrapisispora phaffii (strain ATCC 24235 / CBS 4417 / NBRC 1672 / NRRL Y-8282 / UCD 70-5) TaxID=1071381 RepID=G8BT52_TETPH|nr:hypothetical protein TPHA_0D03900 [Tetrapisispora phaffii CBS 4417]CCE63023.1 hypothetical protein TPHA_0D03900 [Tetrapisispora phaffii CBS 4417]
MNQGFAADFIAPNTISPIGNLRRTFSSEEHHMYGNGMVTSIDTKEIITPPGSTVRGKNKKTTGSLKHPLSPEFSSPITHSKSKKQKSESNTTRSNGNLTLDELIESLAIRNSREELHTKPPYSYATLISLAILQSQDGKLTLAQIYNWISVHFTYYKQKDSGWQNSIRHNLSLNEAFIKTTKADDGKGHYWELKPGYETKFFKNENRSVEQVKAKLQEMEKYFQSGAVPHYSKSNQNDTDSEEYSAPSSARGGSNFRTSSSPLKFAAIHQDYNIVNNEMEVTPSYPISMSPNTASLQPVPTLNFGVKFSSNEANTKDRFTAKRFHTTLGFQRNQDKNIALFDGGIAGNSLSSLGIPSGSDLLKSPQNIQRYTSSFNSSFETSPLPSIQRRKSIAGVNTNDSTQLNTNEDYSGSSILLALPQPVGTDMLKTPKIKTTGMFEKTPVRFITTPRDDGSLLKKWQTPSNIFEDFYCSPLFKGMGTPIKFSSTPNGASNKILSPSGKLSQDNVLKDSNKSQLSSNGLFGVDVYSVWKRATENKSEAKILDEKLSKFSEVEEKKQ